MQLVGDAAFFRAVKLQQTLFAVITAVIIVLAMNLVGSLLTSALIIFPALSAMRIFKSFRSVTICAAIPTAMISKKTLITLRYYAAEALPEVKQSVSRMQILPDTSYGEHQA